MKRLELSKINHSADTQVRVEIDEETVATYAEAMQDGAKFPPIIVFCDGTEYFVGDGFHRIMAAARNKFMDIEADVRKGTRQDALWFALGANKTNGKRLERGDVKKAVEVALREWPNKSQQEIAEQVGCSQFLVNRVQNELISQNKLTLPATRTGKDGKDRPTTYATRTTRTATSATFNPVLDGGEDAQDMGERSDVEDDSDRFKLTAKSIAEKAVFLLSGIKPKDKHRTEALQRVIAYCKKELRR